MAEAGAESSGAPPRPHGRSGGRGAPAPSPADAAVCAALHVPTGTTLHPARYMAALWAACGRVAAARGDGSAARLEVRRLGSVAELHAGPGGPYEAGVIVAAGAAAGALEEFQAAGLPLDNCQGYTLDLVPGDTTGDATPGGPPPVPFPTVAPSLLGSPYIASQGGGLLVVGATKAHGWSAEASLAECGRSVDAGAYQGAMAAAAAALEAAVRGGGASAPAAAAEEEGRGPAAAAAAAAAATAVGAEGASGGSPGRNDVEEAVWQLLSGGAASWPPLLGWQLAGIRTGVRALPPRTPAGSIPLMGLWRGAGGARRASSSGVRGEGSAGSEGEAAAAAAAPPPPPPTWLFVGLGARGLVYHAWLGRCAARAALTGSEVHLPPEALAWRGGAAAGQ
jgi:hypothetical protein